MTLHVNGPLPDVMEILAAGLKDARFKGKDRHPQRFRARYFDLFSRLSFLTVWFAPEAASFDRTTLEVTATQADGSTDVLVAVLAGGVHRFGQRHSSQGLSSAVQELRRRGFSVTTTPWVAPEKD